MGSGAGGLYGTSTVSGGSAVSLRSNNVSKAVGAFDTVRDAAGRVKELLHEESGFLDLGVGVHMSDAECAMVNSELNGIYHTRLEGKEASNIPIRNHLYLVEVRGFDDYAIVRREELE